MLFRSSSLLVALHLLANLCSTVAAQTLSANGVAKKTTTTTCTETTLSPSTGTKKRSKTRTKTKTTIISFETSTSSSSSSSPPTLTSSTSTWDGCGGGEATYTFTFDDLPTNSPVPSNYPDQGFTWSNFNVLNAASVKLNTTSSPNVLQTTSRFGSSIIYEPYSYDYVGIYLKSFDFTCLVYEYGGGWTTTPCDIVVLISQDSRIFPTYEAQNVMGGPYSSTGGPCQEDPPSSMEFYCDLTPVSQVMLPYAQGNSINFVMANGINVASIVVDNLVIVEGYFGCGV